MPNSATCDRCRLLLHQGKARERVALSHASVALKVIFSDSDFCEKREFSQRFSRNSSPVSFECIKRFVALEASGSVRLLRQQQLICITCPPHVADKKFYGKTKRQLEYNIGNNIESTNIEMETSNLQGCSSEGLHDVCESTDLLDHVAIVLKESGANATTLNVSSAGFYFGFCALISHILLAGITTAVVHKCVSLKMVHTAGHAFYCTVGVS